MKKAIFAAAILVLTALQAQAVPKILNYQGFLTEAGSPVTGTRDMTFRVFAAPTGGAVLFTEVHAGADAVTVSAGNFSVLVGELTGGGVPVAVFDGGDRYMEVEVGVTILPRQRIVSVAYSIRTETASGLDSTGDILIMPTGNVGIGTSSPQTKLDVAGPIEYRAKNWLRFTRATISSDASDAAKDAQCSSELGGAYVVAGKGEVLSFSGGYANSSFNFSFAGDANLWMLSTDPNYGGVLIVDSNSTSPGMGPLACTHKLGPVRFTRLFVNPADSDVAKDLQCAGEFGQNYIAATAGDLLGAPSSFTVPDSSSFVMAFAGSTSPWYTASNGYKAELGPGFAPPAFLVCIHK